MSVRRVVFVKRGLQPTGPPSVRRGTAYTDSRKPFEGNTTGEQQRLPPSPTSIHTDPVTSIESLKILENRDGLQPGVAMGL